MPNLPLRLKGQPIDYVIANVLDIPLDPNPRLPAEFVLRPVAGYGPEVRLRLPPVLGGRFYGPGLPAQVVLDGAGEPAAVSLDGRRVRSADIINGRHADAESNPPQNMPDRRAKP